MMKRQTYRTNGASRPNRHAEMRATRNDAGYTTTRHNLYAPQHLRAPHVLRTEMRMDGATASAFDAIRSNRRMAVAIAASLLAVLALAIVLVCSTLYASAVGFAGGTGTAGDPYRIANADQLEQLADDVNGGNTYAGTYFELTDNIDLLNVGWDNRTIGYVDDSDSASAHGFAGTFNGAGHTISNLSIDLTKATTSDGNLAVGLFGATQGATIHDLTLSDVMISGDLSQDGDDVAAGCLIGRSILTNVYDCNVLSSTLQDTAGHPSDSMLCAFGGLIGDAYSNATTTTSVVNCSVDCIIIDNTATTATGTDMDTMQAYAGGIVGRVRVQGTDAVALSVENCMFTGSISANGFVAPIVGGTRYDTATVFTDISLQSSFESCYYNATLAQSNRTVVPKNAYNATYSTSNTTAYVYDESGIYSPAGIASSYHMGVGAIDGTQITIQSVTDALNAWDTKNAHRDWRVAKKSDTISLPVLDMRSIAITEVNRADGETTVEATMVGGYPDESIDLAQATWSAQTTTGTSVDVSTVSDTDGSISTQSEDSTAISDMEATVPLSNEDVTVALTYAFADGTTAQTSTYYTVAAAGDISFIITRGYSEDYRAVTSLTGALSASASGGVSETDFTYQWYKGESATAGTEISGATGLTLDVSDATTYPAGTKFTLKATLKTNTTMTYTATSSNQGNTVYVRESGGRDTNNGRTPDTPVKTLAAAYDLLDSDAGASDNTIVIIGTYTDVNSFGITGVSACQLDKPATITGSDDATAANTTKYPAGVLSWYNTNAGVTSGDMTNQKGKVLNADTIIENITLTGNGNVGVSAHIGYIYCQGHNLTIGENVTMAKGTYRSTPKSYGIDGNNTVNCPDFNIIGGYLDWNKADSAGTQYEGGCNITIKSGSFSRIIAGCRNGKLNTTSHNVFGSESDYFKVNIDVDIENSTSTPSGYSYDIALLCGGQTDGSIYAASSINVNAGTVKLLTGSSIGYPRDCGNGGVNNDYVGVLDVNVSGGTVENFYGGCLGRYVSGKDLTVVDSCFKHSSSIVKAENRGSTSDINISFTGGTIESDVYAAGAGGTTGTATNPVSVSLAVSGDTIIKGSVYGGGFGEAPSVTDAANASTQAGTLYGDTSVSISGGTIIGSVYGGGAGTSTYLTDTTKRALAQVHGNTSVSISGGAVSGSVFAAGDGVESADAPDMALVTGNATLVISGGTISGSAYGGGNYGVVGIGTVSDSGSALPYSITSAGSTKVIVTGGSVARSVFGGGEGVGTSTTQAQIKGAVFGSSTVRIYAGTVGEDVFGGGNESRTYAPVSGSVAGRATTVSVNSTNAQIRVDATTGKVLSTDDAGYASAYVADPLYTGLATGRSVSLGGSVFGGANRSASSVFQANDYTVFGDTDVYIKGTSVSFDGENGGVYGDGNLSRVYGTRDITMVGFHGSAIDAQGNTVKALKSFYSLQRADQVVLSDTFIYLKGALDRINSTDTSLYSINRVDALNLYDGSSVQLDTTVNGLGSLWSDVATDRSFRTDDLTDDEKTAYRQAVANGSTWNEQEPNAVIVNNGKWLDVKYAEDSSQAGAYGSVTGLFTLSLLQSNVDEGGAFVYGADGTRGTTADDSTGHFCCVSKATDGSYLNLYTQQTGTYRIWYVKGTTYQYDLTLKGYTTGGTTVTTTAWLPVDALEGKERSLDFDKTTDISMSSSISNCLVKADTTPGDNQFHLDMALNDTTSPYYFTSSSTSSDSCLTSYTTDQTLVPVTFSLDLGSNIKEQTGTVSFQLLSADGTSTYHITLNIKIEVPSSLGYCISHYGKIFGDVSFQSTIPITGKSAYTAEFVTTYSPSAYPNKSWSIRSYATSALNGEDAGTQYNNFFFSGTKITMIDLTDASNPRYYYYICDGNQTEINLDSFTDMQSGATGTFSSTKTGNTVVREKLVFIVDLENASGLYGTNSYITLRHSYNNGANDMLSFSMESDGDTVENYVPYTGNAYEPENNNFSTEGVSSLTKGDTTLGVTADGLYDTYSYQITTTMRDDIVNTRFLENQYSIVLTPVQNLPLGSRIVVTRSDGTTAPTRYVRQDGSAEIIADLGDSASCTVSLQLSRFMRYGRFDNNIYNSSVLSVGGPYSSSDPLYSNAFDSINVNINSAWLTMQSTINSVLPNEIYNLKFTNTPTVSGTTVNATLSASKTLASGATDLASNNGLVVLRYVEGQDISTAFDVSSYVTPKAGNASGKTTTFKLKDTTAKSGTTYVYQFRYGTTYESATVEVG